MGAIAEGAQGCLIDSVLLQIAFPTKSFHIFLSHSWPKEFHMILISVISPEIIDKSCCFFYAGIYADMH